MKYYINHMSCPLLSLSLHTQRYLFVAIGRGFKVFDVYSSDGKRCYGYVRVYFDWNESLFIINLISNMELHI